MHPDWRTHDLTLDPGAEPDGREWLITNGTGAFAMGTVSGVNARRYHGLLVAATRPPVGRVVVLNQVIERVTLREGGAPRTIEFGACRFHSEGGRGVFAPMGHTLLRRFERGTAVCWTYQWGKVRLARELHLHWQAQAATVRYRLSGAEGGSLRVAPLISLRDFHALHRKGRGGELRVEPVGGDTVRATRDAGGPLGTLAATLRMRGAKFTGGGDWWYGFHLATETARGQDDTEDNHLAGWFELEVPATGELDASLTVALGAAPAEPCDEKDAARAIHLSRIASSLTKAAGAPALGRALAIAADDFVVRRKVGGDDLATVIAGYPWFADWGRDTFISMPGLLLDTGRYDEARSCLRAFARHIRDGLVPNVFNDYDDQAAHYNTVDASLWYVHAALMHLDATRDEASWKEWLGEACASVLDAYIRGTPADKPIIRMAGDGLIAAGDAGTQLTWMDAARDGVVFTPRHGKAVEINALWFSALRGMAKAIIEHGGPPVTKADHYEKLASRVTRSFVKVFWNESLGCLHDHVWTDADGNDHADASVRPNQVIALCLPESPLPRKRQEMVLRVVRERLLTPMGLRTLAPDEPAYRSRYEGNLMQRDEAYHQGTVWPWLIGPYAEAVLRVGRFSEASRREARAAIAPLIAFLRGDGLGQLHEVHDADPPHRPDGTPAQAWSVAALIRTLSLLGE